MLRFVIILFLIPCLAGAQLKGNSEKINKNTAPRYPMSEGIITYDISGGATGKATLNFDRSGWRNIERREIVMKRYGIESTEQRIFFVDGDYEYSLNLDNKTGKKSENKYWSNLLGYKTYEATMKAIYNNQSGSLVRQDTLLSKPCDVWTFSKGAVKELWLWRGIPLKIKKEVPGLSYDQTAVKISKDTHPDAFALPAEIVWQD